MARYQVLNYYEKKYGGLFLFNCNCEVNNIFLEKWLSITILTDQPFITQIVWNGESLYLPR